MPNLFAEIIPAQSATGIALGLDFSTFKAASDFQMKNQTAYLMSKING